MARLAAASAVLALALAGCGGNELTVSAASSLTEAFEAYGETTEIEESFSFAGSDELAAQIRKGAPVDVFASANTSLPEALFEEGLVEEPLVFTSNELVLAVPKDSVLYGYELPDTSPLAFLGEVSHFDLVIGARGVPVGDYTRELLSKLPAAVEAQIFDKVRSEEPDVKGIVGKLVAGAADAGFVYASDVEATNGELVEIELPTDLQPEVKYGVAVVSKSENAEAAQEFVDGLLEGAGRDALLESGFRKPEER